MEMKKPTIIKKMFFKLNQNWQLYQIIPNIISKTKLLNFY